MVDFLLVSSALRRSSLCVAAVNFLWFFFCVSLIDYDLEWEQTRLDPNQTTVIIGVSKSIRVLAIHSVSQVMEVIINDQH
jgi:uncharacterized membrane protein (DUF485 family)